MSATGDERVAQLLGEIRDTQRDQLALARRAVELSETQARLAQEASDRALRNQEQAIAAQTRSIEMQRASARLYRIVVVVAGILVLFLVGFAARLLSKYS
jgi:CHASE3 domain sensor protein